MFKQKLGNPISDQLAQSNLRYYVQSAAGTTLIGTND